MGAGRVVACGFGNTDEALRTPDVVQLLARALRPDLACCGRAIGVGVIGYGPLGGMGYHHGLGVTGTDGLQLVAVVDPSVDRRKAAESDFPGVRTYASTDELLGDDDVEVAFVATPPAHHVALTLELLAGRQARGLREAALPHRRRGRPAHGHGRRPSSNPHRPPEPALGSRLRGGAPHGQRRLPRRGLQRRDLRGRLRASLPHVALGQRGLRRRGLRLGIASHRLGAAAPRRESAARAGARPQARLARRDQSRPAPRAHDVERRPGSGVLPERHRRRAPAQVLGAGHGRDARRALPRGDARARRARSRLRGAADAPRRGARRSPPGALRERLRDQRDAPASRPRAAVRLPPEPRRPPAPRRAARRHARLGAAGHRRPGGGPAIDRSGRRGRDHRRPQAP